MPKTRLSFFCINDLSSLRDEFYRDREIKSIILTFILLPWGRPGMNLFNSTTDLTLLAATLYFSIMLNLLNLYFNSSFLSTVSLFFRDPNFQVNIDFLFPFTLIFSLSANYIIHLKLFLDPSFPSHFQGQFLSLSLGFCDDALCSSRMSSGFLP